MQALRVKLSLQNRWSGEIQSEYQSSLVTAPKAKNDAWIVYGRVVDPSGLGLPNHRVDALWRQKQLLGYACTDEAGRFHIEVGPNAVPKQGNFQGNAQSADERADSAAIPEAMESDAVILRVSDSRGIIRHMDEKPMHAHFGGRIARRIVIDGGKAEDSCLPAG